MTSYELMHEFTGYFVVSTHGHTRRGTVTLARNDDGRWSDLDGIDSTNQSKPSEVVLQEAFGPPEWSGEGDPRDGRPEIRFVAAVWDTDAAFVLDPDGAAWLKENYRNDVSWLSDQRSIDDVQRDDPVGWVGHMGGLTIDQALIAFLDNWHGWATGSPDVADIKAQIQKTVSAMVELAQCDNAISDATVTFGSANDTEGVPQ